MSSSKNLWMAEIRLVRSSIQFKTARNIFSAVALLDAGGDEDLSVLYLGDVAIQRTRGGPAQYLAVHGEQRGVARAHEGLHGLFPVIRAPEMRAQRTERHHLVLVRAHHPGAGFFHDFLPSVHA